MRQVYVVRYIDYFSIDGAISKPALSHHPVDTGTGLYDAQLEWLKGAAATQDP